MKFIGITGGVGAGKSTILAYLRKNYRVRTMIADETAHEIMEPGYDCYVRLQKEFSQEKIWLPNGRINRRRLADVIFSDDEKRERLNNIVHPAVREYIEKEVEKERRIGSLDYFILEAALLIEDGFYKICDELWYVYVSEENRRKRLIESRGYTDERVGQIFAAQLPESEYRRHSRVIIDNNGPIAQVYLQLAQLLNDKGEEQMEQEVAQEEENTRGEVHQYVFGLDIGTRNVVGTVGYKKEKEFIVVAQYSMEHETRAMLDGQIHDIGRVGNTIAVVKEKLEEQIGQKLTDVCIAAAGRVLKTVTTDIEYEFSEETVVTAEHIHTLDLMGVDKAAQQLKEANDTNYRFYCVGYSVMKYYLNDEIFSNLESHKAEKISEKIIVTFLPEDVVDGLYMAVGQAGLSVANMTLEPIAAIDVAIPENFRMLNIALVDVGAGTSDISLTRDGSIIAYGMIPFAGDELTETIVQHYLVDFRMAEHMKLASGVDDEIEFEDIMSLKHTIPAEEIWKLTEPLVDKMTTEVAEKIMELNGGQSVSATFIVGGGGKIHGFDEQLAKKLDLPQERVALRGAEVLKEVTFLQEDIVKDPLLVTPIGICLNFYEQKNNFIMVYFNGERLRLYDNSKLTIVDAAIQAGFPNEQLFPKRGYEIRFTVNGRPRVVRGENGKAAVVTMNGKPASINDPIEPDCSITITPSTAGRGARRIIGELEEYHSSTITFEVNGRLVTCPRYVEVNGVLEPPSYEIQENDAVVLRSFYTVQQLADYMDAKLDPEAEIYVNNRPETPQALVYENYGVEWTAVYHSAPLETYPKAGAGRRMSMLDDAGRQEGKPVRPKRGQSREAQPALLQAAGIEKKPAAQLNSSKNETPPVQLEDSRNEEPPVQQESSRNEEPPVHRESSRNEEPSMQQESVRNEEPSMSQKGSNNEEPPVRWESSRNEEPPIQPERAGSKEPPVQPESAGSKEPSAYPESAESKEPSAYQESAGSKEPSAYQESAGSEKPFLQQAAGTAGNTITNSRSELSGQGTAAVSKRMDRPDLAAAPAQEASNMQIGETKQENASGSALGGSGQENASGSAAGMPQQKAVEGSAYGTSAGSGRDSSAGRSERDPSAGGLAAQGGSGQDPAESLSAPGGSEQALSAGRSEQALSAGRFDQQPSAEGVQAPAEESAASEKPQQNAKAGSGQDPAADIPQASVQDPKETLFQVVVNGETITLNNKKEYIFVDVFDHIQFNLSQARGRVLVTEVNGAAAQYTQEIHPGDVINIYWKES